MFLLQNWRQFLEVSLEYLKACDPAVHRVRHEQAGFPANYALSSVRSAESAVDSSDPLSPERETDS